MRVLASMTALVALACVAGCQSAESVDDVGMEAEASDAVSTLDLEVGQCLNDVDQPLAQDLTEIPSVDCKQPHQSEVFAEVVLEDGDYPGVDSIVIEAVARCEAEFAEFVGIDFRSSGLSYHYYYPTQRTWADGDRSVFCVVFDPGVDSVGSLAGSAR
jgi:hypothetical protein